MNLPSKECLISCTSLCSFLALIPLLLIYFLRICHHEFHKLLKMRSCGVTRQLLLKSWLWSFQYSNCNLFYYIYPIFPEIIPWKCKDQEVWDSKSYAIQSYSLKCRIRRVKLTHFQESSSMVLFRYVTRELWYTSTSWFPWFIFGPFSSHEMARHQ